MRVSTAVVLVFRLNPYNNNDFILVSVYQGQIQEFLIGGPNFGSERIVELFCGKLLLQHPQNPLPPVAVARYNSLAPYRVLECYS